MCSECCMLVWAFISGNMDEPADSVFTGVGRWIRTSAMRRSVENEASSWLVSDLRGVSGDLIVPERLRGTPFVSRLHSHFHYVPIATYSSNCKWKATLQLPLFLLLPPSLAFLPGSPITHYLIPSLAAPHLPPTSLDAGEWASAMGNKPARRFSTYRYLLC